MSGLFNNIKISGNTNASGATVTFTNAVYSVFTNSNVAILIWFLVVYFLIYFLVGLFRPGTQSSSVVRLFDIVAIGAFLAYCVATFFQQSEKDREATIYSYYTTLKNYMNSPTSLLSIGFFILSLYILVFMLGIPMAPGQKPITVTILENGAWILFVIVLIASFFNYFMGISITTTIDTGLNTLQQNANQAQAAIRAATNANNNKGNGNAKSGSASTGSGTNNSVNKNEVFNVGNNMFTYDDAQSVCQSLGARLATYKEIETAYNDGAEWCNYGWSDNQSAYFPTQLSTWTNLQSTSNQKNACGRPGVNGGYIENPKLRYGANCYGVKPKPKDSDLAALNTNSLIPKTPDDEVMDLKIKFWKDNADKLLKINSYNNTKWSEF